MDSLQYPPDSSSDGLCEEEVLPSDRPDSFDLEDDDDNLYDGVTIRGEYCDICQKVPWEKMFKEVHSQWASPSSNGQHLSSPYELLNTASLFQRLTCQSECPLCQVVWGVYRGFGSTGSTFHARPDLRLWICLVTVHQDFQALPYVECPLVIRKSDSVSDNRLDFTQFELMSPRLNVRMKRSSSETSTSVHVPAPNLSKLRRNCSLQKYAVNSSIPPKPLSRSTMATISACLSQCRSCHQRVEAFVDGHDRGRTFMPTRVLKIGGDKSLITIIDTASMAKPLRYAALSHCWGKEKFLTTRLANLYTHKKGIKIALLPQSFKDAIDVCRILVIEFLWIDSLCIVQDDPRDWDIESAKMGDIYKNGYLTIAAARASSALEGFLGPRTLTEYENFQNGLQYCEPIPGLYVGTHGVSFDLATLGTPLSSRAWVMQERYLSPRILFFTKDGIYWSCKCLQVGEVCDVRNFTSGFQLTLQQLELSRKCSRKQPRLNATESSNHSSMRLSKSSSSVYLKAKEHSFIGSTLCQSSCDGCMYRHMAYSDWYTLITAYSFCGLSKNSDRLPALSGLVNEIVLRTGERYFAGILEDTLIRGLSWFCQDGSGHNITAPSWSWASCDCGIIFGQASDGNQCASVSEIFVQHKGSNLFGEVAEGSLTLLAPTMKLQKWFSSLISSSGRMWIVAKALDNNFEFAALLDDMEDGILDEAKLALLTYICRSPTGLPDFCALLLRPTGNGTYRRFGLIDYRAGERVDQYTFARDEISTGEEWIAALPKEEFVII